MKSWWRDGWIWTAALIGAGVITWNALHLIGAEAYTGSTRRLVYLPRPEVSRVMALGHVNTAAKLQWMDSFTYFQSQIDLRDDSVAGGKRGAFDRLYANLISMDPFFAPYYEYGATALGGLMEDHHAELSLLMLATDRCPQESNLWSLRAACLRVFFDFEQRFPEQFESMLQEWADAERRFGSGKEYWPLKWIETMGRRYDRGLVQAEYWGRQRISTESTSKRGLLAEALLREQLARHGVRRLQALADGWQQTHGSWPDGLAEVAVPALVAAVYRGREWAMSPGEPVLVADGQATLQIDPYGYNYLLADGEVISLGVEKEYLNRRMGAVNKSLAVVASEQGAWADSVEAAWASLEMEPIPLPEGMAYELEQRRLRVVWVGEPVTPWTTEQLLTAVGLGEPSASPTEATK